MLSPEYISGLFDGEGTVSIIYSKIRRWKRDPSKYVYGFKIVVGVCNTFHPILYRLQDQFGGDINISNMKRTENQKAVGVWKISGHEKMRFFLTTIQPFSIIKKQQIALGLRYLKTSLRSGQRITQGAWQERIAIFDELRAINKRGAGKHPSNNIPDNPPEGWNPKRRNYSDQELADMMQHMRSFQAK